MKEHAVTITDDDVAFVRRAKNQYQLLAEVAEKEGEHGTAGIFRKQEFYAERFLLRITEAP